MLVKANNKTAIAPIIIVATSTASTLWHSRLESRTAPVIMPRSNLSWPGFMHTRTHTYQMIYTADTALYAADALLLPQSQRVVANNKVRSLLSAHSKQDKKQ